jgi:hypothetical protein
MYSYTLEVCLLIALIANSVSVRLETNEFSAP